METLSSTNQRECNEALIFEVVMAVARNEQSDPLSLPPLSDVVDPDALEQVARSTGVTEISFSYHGYHVRIEDSERVHVTPE